MKAREIPGLEPDTVFREAAARAMWVRTEEVFSFREGVLDTTDIERVHDMRVATRRLRAVMEVFAPCFPRKPHRAALREVKHLADALGERRDPDVHIDALERIAGRLGAEERPGIESLADALEADQEAANQQLARVLEELDSGNLEGRLQMLAEMARVRSAG
jgi:CHAD domain-containing protein